MLQTLQEPHTTTELAEHAGVSLSSASEHAAVLRRAGLVASVRERQQVRHILTQLGADLLSAGAPTSLVQSNSVARSTLRPRHCAHHD
ncbi:winged helix-turn-helix domain-containing protein [Streptomyces sp. NBC_01381]|uniref:ArsR/SmtB family transcription factor n=1 Tax=Streptomyces sp. NBC_01381 TaxID=2903845 RepID=UPI00225542EC|nr:winged helix-turn-helix domain-containing protein [Streptomyces sp. NBC_01381]MCX4672535.1 winged helix-turn-helix domain-containing protein [Streptomyces sp. NBC_01381]